MKKTSTLITSLAGWILTVATLPLCAQEREAARPPVNREEIRRQLRELPPDERRALILELRDQKATQPSSPGSRP